jgi:O-antigen/teichoic acid export membrane protein
VSEQTEWEAHAIAGLIVVTGTGILLSVGVLFFRDRVEQYVGTSVASFVAGILLLQLGYNIVTSILSGQRRVHLSGLLNAGKVVLTKILQLLLVYGGLKLTGLLIGQWLSLLFVLIVGLYLSNLEFTLPHWRHFRSLWEYAKFSWLGALKSQSFNNVDILVLGVYVQSSLIGIYSVAWTISKFLSLFDDAIRQTVFPEISYSDTHEDPNAVANLVTESLRFSGFITIPGLVGGFLIGDRLLRIYGAEFQQGTAVLGLLIFAILIYGYQQQMLSGLNAIERPDLAFRINIVFIGSNIVMNITLIQMIGWVGAALATVLSAVIGLSLSIYILSKFVNFTIPYQTVGVQIISALIMGGVVYVVLFLEQVYEILQNNVVTVLIVVTIGASVYFLTLWIISSQFRETVRRNIRVKQLVPGR